MLFTWSSRVQVLISEYLTGGPAIGCGAPASMRREGLAMLRAVVADVASMPGFSVVTTLEADQPLLPNCETIRVVSIADEDVTFQRLLSQVDAVLIIAPETDGILASRCRRVREAGVACWNCSNEAIELCGDKLRLAEYLQERGLPTIDTRLVNLAEMPLRPSREVDAFPCFDGSAGASTSREIGSITLGDSSGPFVLKPRDGAGSNLTFLVRDLGDWKEATAQLIEQGQSDNCLIQPFLEGRALSVGVNISLDRSQIDRLPVGEQRLSTEGRFHYRGGIIPASISTTQQRAIHDVVRSACESISGLAGYIGFDLILTADGTPVIVEINPRLTTSYIGYRQLYSEPLSRRWIDAQYRFSSPHAEPIQFAVDKAD